MAIVQVTDQTFNRAVIQSDKLVLVDYWAPWCGPCRMIAPILEELAAELGDKIVIAKLNVDENPGVASIYQIMSIPTMKLFKTGKVVDTIVGLQPKHRLQHLIHTHL